MRGALRSPALGWAPDGKRLSYEYGGSVYTVPVD